MALSKTVLSPEEISTSFIHTLINSQEYASKPAVSCEDKTISFDELNRRANRLANFLQKKGVMPDAIVAISLKPSLEMMIGILGILKAGGAYLPIDPTNPRERVDLIIKDASPTLILTSTEFKELFNNFYLTWIKTDACQEVNSW